MSAVLQPVRLPTTPSTTPDHAACVSAVGWPWQHSPCTPASRGRSQAWRSAAAVSARQEGGLRVCGAPAGQVANNPLHHARPCCVRLRCRVALAAASILCRHSKPRCQQRITGQ